MFRVRQIFSPIYLNYFQTRLIQTALGKESLREALLRVSEPRTLTEDE